MGCLNPAFVIHCAALSTDRARSCVSIKAHLRIDLLAQSPSCTSRSANYRVRLYGASCSSLYDRGKSGKLISKWRLSCGKELEYLTQLSETMQHQIHHLISRCLQLCGTCQRLACAWQSRSEEEHGAVKARILLGLALA